MDQVFKALADPSRRRLLDNLNRRNGQTLTELGTTLDMARQSVSKHLAVLEAAQLVVTQRRGREKLHYLNAEPINAIADRWINQYHRERARVLADLRQALEADPISDTAFIYVTYINSSPGRIWQALTDPEFGAAHGFDEAFIDRVAYEHRSQVTFTIEPQGAVVKLTVVHDHFDPGSLVLANVRQGWPGLLSNLKTLLETGETLPQAAAAEVNVT